MTPCLPAEFESRLNEILPQRPAGLFEPKSWQSFRINTLKLTVEQAHRLLANRRVDFQQVDFCPYAILIDERISELQNNSIEQQLASESIDVTLPGRSLGLGSIHPITKSFDELRRIFTQMGFDFIDKPAGGAVIPIFFRRSFFLKFFI